MKYLFTCFDLFMIVYKKTEEWYIEWQWVKTSNNEWYNEWQQMTTSDNEWQQVTTSGTTTENERQRVVTSANFPFLRIKEESFTLKKQAPMKKY